MNREVLLLTALLLSSSGWAQTARDPHAHSAGFTHDSGPYTDQGRQPLALADSHRFVTVLGDRIEYSPATDTGSYEIQAGFGDSFSRLLLKTHGSLGADNAYENQTELLWSEALGAFFNRQIGLRLDSQEQGKNRQWLAAGIQGLAPYWFELEATAYIGSGGQSELVFDTEYSLLLTQRLIIEPRLELTVRGKDDASNQLASGLAYASASVRLRYEISRQFAPFIGVESKRLFGGTAKLRTRIGGARNETRYVAGLRFWF